MRKFPLDLQQSPQPDRALFGHSPEHRRPVAIIGWVAVFATRDPGAADTRHAVAYLCRPDRIVPQRPIGVVADAG